MRIGFVHQAPVRTAASSARHVSTLIPLILSVLVGAIGAFGCEDQPTRVQGRAGVAVALEARHTAALVARGIASAPDEACGTYPVVGPMTAEVRWRLSGTREPDTRVWLEETRTLTLDDRGRAREVRVAVFESEQGRSGRREREWRLVDDQIYTRDQNLMFERRAADIAEVRQRLLGVREVFETMVRVSGLEWRKLKQTSGGWELSAADSGVWGERVHCGIGEDDPWLRALRDRMSVGTASANVAITPGAEYPTERWGTWTLRPVGLETQPSLRVEVREEIIIGPPADPIEAPGELFEVTRARPFRDVETFVEALDGMLADRDFTLGASDGGDLTPD